MLAALLLGGDDFRRALMIAASAGYDTNCNAGSVGCLNGVRLGLAAIPDDLREPVADRLLVVTAEGGRCVSDAVQETRRILHARAAFAGAPLPASQPRFSFELPGARQGFAPCPYWTPNSPAAAPGRGDAHGPTRTPAQHPTLRLTLLQTSAGGAARPALRQVSPRELSASRAAANRAFCCTTAT